MTPGRGQRPRRGIPRGRRGNKAGGGRGGHHRRGPTPFPWDAQKYSARITENFKAVETRVAQDAVDGVRPSSARVRTWHKASLEGVTLAEPEVAGQYRGQGSPTSRLFRYLNQINGVFGSPPHNVPGEVTDFFSKLDARLDELDERVAAGASAEDIYDDVLQACAWLHGRWVRIHPFADHNGSTARLLTVMVGLRYGIPLRLPGKPRSDLPTAGLALDYNVAAENQMAGDDQLMELFLHNLVTETLKGIAADAGGQQDPDADNGVADETETDPAH